MEIFAQPSVLGSLYWLSSSYDPTCDGREDFYTGLSRGLKIMFTWRQFFHKLWNWIMKEYIYRFCKNNNFGRIKFFTFKPGLDILSLLVVSSQDCRRRGRGGLRLTSVTWGERERGREGRRQVVLLESSHITVTLRWGWVKREINEIGKLEKFPLETVVSFVFTLCTFKGSSLCLLYLIVPFGTVNNNKFGWFLHPEYFSSTYSFSINL